MSLPTRLAALADALDRGVARPRRGSVRVLAWAGTNYALLLLAVVLAYVLAALPPLSLLPSRYPLDLQDHVLLAWFYGSLGWPVHLYVVAAASRARRARWWMVLSTPLLSVWVLGLVYLGVTYATGRSAVLAYTLYGLICRPYPRRGAPPVVRAEAAPGTVARPGERRP